MTWGHHKHHHPKHILPVTMADCVVTEDDDKTTKISNGSSQAEQQHSGTPKQQSKQKQKFNNASPNSNNHESFNRSGDILQFQDISIEHQQQESSKGIDHDSADQLYQSIPLESLLEGDEDQNENNQRGVNQHDQQHPQQIHQGVTGRTGKGVKNAGKKVLQVAVTRPWKSVKRRLTGTHAARHDYSGDHSHGSYGAMDDDDNDPYGVPARRSSYNVNRAATAITTGVGDPSEISATSAYHASHHGGTPMPHSVRGLLSPAASLRDPGDRIRTPTESVLAASEYGLRCAVLLLLAFWLGAHYQQYAAIVTSVAGYVVVAWVTCALVRWTAAWQEVRQLRQLRRAMQPVEVAADDEQTPLLYGSDGRTTTTTTTTTPGKQQQHVRDEEEDGEMVEEPAMVAAAAREVGTSDGRGSQEMQHGHSFDSTEDEENRRDDEGGATSSANTSVKDEFLECADVSRAAAQQQQQQKVLHPSLHPFFIVNTADNKRVFANSSDLMFPIDNEYFTGKMLALIRTPDADDEYAVKGTEENDRASSYFRGRQRRFDFQFEFRVKKIPKGRVYFMVELGEPVKMGMIQRAFASAALAFVKTANPNLHYSISGTAEKPDGRWECPHIAFPIEEGMDRVVATPLGETPPALGQEIFEDEAAIKLRKKTRIDWRTDVTYTLSLYSSYADFLNWRVVNLPGIKPFSISSLIGPQPMFLTLYELMDRGDGKPQKHHYRCNTINIMRLEMCNSAWCRTGTATKAWLQSQDSEVAAANAIADIEKQVDVADDEASGADNGEMESDEESDGDNDSTDGLLMTGGRSQTVGFATADQSEGAAEELGEGIYLRSGDSLSLRELLTEDDLQRGRSSGHLTNGGGFAVLQEQNAETTIVIEKAGKSRVRRNARASSKLIKSGDTVIFKLVARGRKADDAETKYLSIHRGWWLKWVSSAPTKNGYFTVHTHETEYADRGDGALLPPETQSSYLTLGGSFSLRHKRWKQYRVGIASDPSTTYGGRMLGLHIPSKDGGGSNLGGGGGGKLDTNSGDEVETGRLDVDSQVPSKKGEWMRPLLLQAYESGSATGCGLQMKATLEDTSFEEIDDDNENTLSFSQDQYNMDVPAWVDVFNRTDRLRTHLYVVRVLPPESLVSPKNDFCGDERNSDEEKTDASSYVRLRSGRDLAEIMRAGLKWRNRAALPRRSRSSVTDPQLSPTAKVTDSPMLAMRHRANSFPTSPLPDASGLLNVSSDSQDDRDMSQILADDDGNSDVSSDEWEVQSDGGEALVVENLDGSDAFVTAPTKRRGKGRKLIGKIAKGVKTTTTTAARTGVKVGTTAARTSVKVGTTAARTGMKVGMGTVYAGKATVNAGKSIIPIRPKKPPIREPKSTLKKAKKRRDKGLYVDVKSRSIKRIERLESRSALVSASFLAGELCAPEQSCRSVSNMISRMSAEPESSAVSARFSSLLRSLVDSSSVFDDSFLQGGSLQIGVTANKVDKELGALLLDCLVARCLWESHWREEWCGVYEKGVVFYAPLTDRPCLELPFLDIMSVRLLEDDVVCPLSGYPVLVVETAWLCHYCAFSNDEVRQEFYKMIDGLLLEHEAVSAASFRDNELAEARFWQGFQMSVESSQTDGGGKWAKIVCGSKTKNRTILNNRRMVFDLGSDIEPSYDDANSFIEDLLSTALSFSFDELKQHPEAFVQFLDSTSLLRTIRLEEFDRESPQVYCIFVNLYHCLLQHALLCSVNGPLHKRAYARFMLTSCYEIGGDVFSLAELYSCVIRGNMPRPITAKPPYIEAPKKSSAYKFYALTYTNPNTNFLLNTADMSCPRSVPVLNPSDFEEQIETQTAAFIRRSVTVDPVKRHVVLPKVMDVYRSDFTTDSSTAPSYECLRYCFRYMDMDMATKIRALYDEGNTNPLVLKYHPLSEQFHMRLVSASPNLLMQTATPSSDSANVGDASPLNT